MFSSAVSSRTSCRFSSRLLRRSISAADNTMPRIAIAANAIRNDSTPGETDSALPTRGSGSGVERHAPIAVK